jgi:hypothetical protein
MFPFIALKSNPYSIPFSMLFRSIAALFLVLALIYFLFFYDKKGSAAIGKDGKEITDKDKESTPTPQVPPASKKLPESIRKALQIDLGVHGRGMDLDSVAYGILPNGMITLASTLLAARLKTMDKTTKFVTETAASYGVSVTDYMNIEAATQLYQEGLLKLTKPEM